MQRVTHGHQRQAVEGTQQDEAAQYPEGCLQQRPQARPAVLVHHLLQRRHQAGAATLYGKAHQQGQEHTRQQDHALALRKPGLRQA
ncbi:hypothetical protein D3C78_1614380 [compost metagenome]